MKLVYKRRPVPAGSSALPRAAEALGSQARDSQAYSSQASPAAAAPDPSPAPAGALHRASPPGETALPQPPFPPEDEYVPQRGSYRMRLRGGIPRSVAGRILASAGALTILGIVTLTVAAVRHFLLHDPRFAISTSTEITMDGNEHISRADVLGVFGSDLERNIFSIPLEERRADLERLPWVAHATIERLLPHALRVRVLERTPVAFVRQGSHIGLVDGEGVLLDMPPESAGDPHYSFPVLTGLAPDDTPALRATRMDVYHRFMADLDGGAARRTQMLSEVDVTNPEDVKALVTSNGTDILVHFGDEDFRKRFEAYEQHLPEWRIQYPKLAAADMRYERQVVLEMAGNATPLTDEASLPPDPGKTPPASGPTKVNSSARRPVAGSSSGGARLVHALAAHKAAVQATARERR